MHFVAYIAVVFLYFGESASANSVSSVLTSKAGDRFSQQLTMHWKHETPAGENVLIVNTSSSKQSIFGFGTALTESAAFNFAQLTPATRNKVVNLLWAPPPVGNGYSTGRLHLGSADFSLQTYSLDESPADYNLTDFDTSLSHDEKYVLPLARAAQTASKAGKGLRLFFSPWSPPAWLKINQDMINSAHPEGVLQTPEAGQALANYFVAYAKSVAAAGVPMWGCTLQNEPLMKMVNKHYEACAWTPESQGRWLRDHLGPAVRGDPATAHLFMMGYDWNKGELADWARTMEAINANNSYIDGYAVHWYQWGGGLKLEDLAALQEQFPGKFTMGTEASLIKHGIAAEEEASMMGTYSHDVHGTMFGPGAPPGNDTVAYTYASGELYALDILGDLNFGGAGWVDWNAVLDFHGGPNHINRSDIGAPILVDASSDSFYVQSPYYYMGHISRFAPPDSVRMSCHGEHFAATPTEYDNVKDYIKPQIKGDPAPSGEVDMVAACFKMADGSSGTVVVMNPNGGDEGKEITLSVAGLGAVVAHMPANSIKTFSFDL